MGSLTSLMLTPRSTTCAESAMGGAQTRQLHQNQSVVGWAMLLGFEMFKGVLRST